MPDRILRLTKEKELNSWWEREHLQSCDGWGYRRGRQAGRWALVLDTRVAESATHRNAAVGEERRTGHLERNTFQTASLLLSPAVLKRRGSFSHLACLPVGRKN